MTSRSTGRSPTPSRCATAITARCWADGKTVYVADADSNAVSVIDAAVSAVNLGGDTPQSGDGYEPTGIVVATTPTPGS